MNEEHYDASDIQVLEGLEAVRKRPGMYIGTTDVKGLHHLVWEIVDNAIDESLAGYCNNIEVVINKGNSITVKDDGRGIPVDVHPKTHLSTVETVYTVLHAGGKFGGGGYKVSGGLHGVGASVVNALSKWVEVTVYKNGKIHFIKFENGGHTVEPLKVIGDCEENRTGTWVTFKPDPEIFDTDVYDYETLKIRCRELAFLNRGLKITIRDDRDDEDTTGETFMYEGGISEYVRFINQGKTPIHDNIIHLEGEEDNVFFEVALQYNTGFNDNIYSFGVPFVKNYVMAISAGNTIKKVTAKNYSMSQKGLSDNSTITDVPLQIESFASNDTVLIFTNQGNAIKRTAEEIKECKWRDKGAGLLSIEKTIALNEIPVCIMKLPAEGSILFMTKQGMVKKSDVKDLMVGKGFYQVCKLADQDEVISVEVDKAGKSILMLSKNGMSLNFDKTDIPTQGRISGGVKGINLDDGDSVIFASQADFDHVVVVSQNGYIKKMSISQFPLSQRYRKGLKYINFAKNCQSVFFACGGDKSIKLAVDFGLKILPLDTQKLPDSERLTTGNEVIKKTFLTISKLL